MDKKWHKRQKRVFEVLEVGNDLDYVSRAYDYVNASAIILNWVISILYTYAELRERCGEVFLLLEEITVVFFCIDYVLRIWTAKFLYPDLAKWRACGKHDIFYGNCGFIILFAVFSAVFSTRRNDCVSNDSYCAYIQIVLD